MHICLLPRRKRPLPATVIMSQKGQYQTWQRLLGDLGQQKLPLLALGLVRIVVTLVPD
jgi:hypothetical protein